MPDKINAQALIIYYHPFEKNAPTIYENIYSFEKHSRYTFININAFHGFPKKLNQIRFDIILLHYSAFSSLSVKFLSYLKNQKKSKIVSFFQDEHMNCKKRFKMIDSLNIQIIFSMLENKYHNIYENNTSAKTVYHNLTGYVDDSLIDSANTLRKSFDKRTVDIGYRARPLPYYNGRGAQEKTQIGEKFIDMMKGSDLTLDVKMGEEDRIYGEDWHRFIANCKGMLGVEAGTSIFDIDGTAEQKCNDYLLKRPNASFEEVHKAVLAPYEDKVFYRTISPRVFECAAFKTCMILYEGKYNGILEPNVHYIPLKKDFSNIEAVLNTFHDEEKRVKIVENAYRDLIESQKYSYKSFIKDFDDKIYSTFDTSLSKYARKGEIYKLINEDKFYRITIIKLKLYMIKIYLLVPFRKFIFWPLKFLINLFKKTNTRVM